MRGPLQRLSTRYALLFAAVLLVVTLTSIAVSGYLVFQRINELRAELVASFATIHSTNEIAALRQSGAYLSNRLFNPLYQLDIASLNEELQQIQSWLQPRSIHILDQNHRIITDGSADNADYGRQMAVPEGLTPGAPVVQPANDGRLLFLVVGYGDNLVGYARVALSNELDQRLAQALDIRVSSAWEKFKVSYQLLALINTGGVFLVSIAIGWLLSESLSRPLRSMAAAADEYANGRLDHKIDVHSKDELGRLARSLNQMASDLQVAENRLTRAQEMGAFGYWEWRPDSETLLLSSGIYNILGVTQGEVSATAKDLSTFVVAKDRGRLFAWLREKHLRPLTVEFDILRRDGDRRKVLLRGEPAGLPGTLSTHYLGTLQDVTEQHLAKEELQRLANYDSLTGLPNRNLFYDRLNHAISQARRRQSEFALLFLDLDRFKSINDALGHDVGDELLQYVASRLRGIVRECDTLVRMGGDEFTLIVEDLNDEESPQKVAQKIIDALVSPFRLCGRDLFVSASIGIALYPRDATQTDTLIRNADTAMYLAKEQGKGTLRLFTPELDHAAHERLVLESQLRQAIENSEFELHYQPQVRSSNGELLAFEALLRWRRNGELQPAGKFVPVLEETGLITRITGFVLNRACSDLCEIQKHHSGELRMSINLSGAQFQQVDLLMLIDRTLEKIPIRPEQLEMEITESTLLDRDTSHNNGLALAARRIRLAIDDFGTGYSSLTYLKQFDVDALKIDQSFVRNICSDQEDAQITATLLGLAHNLGLDSIAEGVETPEQLEQLRAGGCDLIQGYLISKPLPLKELLVWIGTHRGAPLDLKNG